MPRALGDANMTNSRRAYRAAGFVRSKRRSVLGRLSLTIVLLGCVSIWPSVSYPAERADAHYAEGIAHFQADRFEEAAVAFEMARRLDPAHASAHVYLGAARFRLERPAEALKLLRAGFALDPSLDGDITRMYLALTLEKLKLYRSARAVYVEVAAFDPRSRLATRARKRVAAIDALFDPPPSPLVRQHYQRMGMMAFRAGDPQGTVDALTELQLLEREVPGPAPLAEAKRAWFYLGAALNQLERYAEALDVLEQADSAPAALAVQRGRALMGLDRHGEARRAFEKARRLDGDGPWARSAARFLQSLESTSTAVTDAGPSHPVN